MTNDALDPHGKIPEFKVCAVQVAPVNPRRPLDGHFAAIGLQGRRVPITDRIDHSRDELVHLLGRPTGEPAGVQCAFEIDIGKQGSPCKREIRSFSPPRCLTSSPAA
ncbi:MAG: hypothetical protein CM1200mP2_32180 [Planctomycetaceae bacterium]|nr:MAG: hypothetical protein CM1200mP2_32180 [Planctomycetaceae bacterium]